MANFAELTNFIVSLSEKPDLARRFKENPKEVVDQSQLSAETKALLTSGREDFMAEVFGDEELRRPVTKVVTKTSVHVSTNTNNHVTTTVLVVVL
jgi:hypothetical protein